MCTLLVEKGTFTLTGNQTVTLTGSFQPKALILFTTGQATIDGTYADDARIAYGFTDGTNKASISGTVDESAEAEYYNISQDALLRMSALTSSAQNIIITSASFGATGFTLSGVATGESNVVIHYIAIGGTDITNVSVVNTTVGATTTGNKSYSGSGTTFTPDFALTMTGADGSVSGGIVGSSDQFLFCLGAAKSTTEQFVMWGRDETVGTSDADCYVNDGACLASCSTTAGTITFLANFVSFDNAAGGGITVNVTDGADSATKPISFLLIKGGNWDCGTFAQRSGTGTQNVTTTSGLTSKLVFLGGTAATANATVTANNYVGIGASDGTREGSSWYGNTNGLGTFVAAQSQNNTKVYRMATPAATGSSSTTVAECDVSSMSTAGQFTLDWTTADTTLRQMAYWVVGTAAAGGNNITRAMPTETITSSDSRTLLRNKTRARTETVTATG